MIQKYKSNYIFVNNLHQNNKSKMISIKLNKTSLQKYILVAC